MKKLFVLFFFFSMFFAANIKVQAQSCDILYFCVKYDDGEKDCSDRFYAGTLTVMAKLANPVYYEKVFVQMDKFEPRTGEFKYYNDYEFTTDPDMTYIFFPGVEFKDRGFYRVFLLNPNKDTITSAIVEII
ncbi:MAG: hypothetical protein V1773_11780 [bacterium]